MNNKKPLLPPLREIIRHRAFVPSAVFVALVLALSLSSRFADHPPVIEGIAPEVGYPGMVLLIKGNYFGAARGSSEVSFAGDRPSTSAYLQWTNRRISVRIPEGATSGFVFVTKSNGRSNGVLFTNKSSLPVIVSAGPTPGLPFIQSITPASGTAGTLVTIRGQNFGFVRGQGKVYFTPVSVADQGQPAAQIPNSGSVAPAADRFTGCGCDFNYVNWTDKEINMYVPDGASSGNVTVVTDKGTSNSSYFEVAGPVGTKLYKDRRGYQIEYGMQISNVVADPAGTIDVWMPALSEDLSQRDIQRVLDPHPLWDDFRGVMRYHFDDLKPDTTYPIDITYYFDRYAVETHIDPAKVSAAYDSDRELYRVYTESDALVPSDDPTIVSRARSIVGGEKNPYLKALAIYDYLIDKLHYDATATTAGVVDSLSSGSADSYDYALLFTALARSAGVPTRPVAGYIVYGDKQTSRFYWAEFYVKDFGWVPVDPVLGSGVKFGDFPAVSDPRAYYFGNIDNQHIAFSRGVIQLEPLDPHGKTVRKNRMFSLQTIHEEASSGVSSYTSFWQDAKIVDWW